MANENVTIYQLNNSDIYEKLYPQTSATQSKLSAKTSALFSAQIIDADTVLKQIANNLKTLKNVVVRVVDADNNPVVGAIVQNIMGDPVTDDNGEVGGVWLSDPLTIVSPYADMLNATANAASYAGTTNVLTVKLPSVAENTVIRYTSTSTVKFSPRVKNIDICCVGGGGGGSGGYGHTSGSSGGSSWAAASWRGKGGGGGNIVNSYEQTVSSNVNLPLTVGAGGLGSDPLTYSAASSGEQKANKAGNGGTTSFLGIGATGGTGASTSAGISNNGGNGGSGNASGTEFDDGATYYSGGGANAGYPIYDKTQLISGPVGGTPYGGYGGYKASSNGDYYGVAGGNGLGSGGGGGGGNANPSGSSSDILQYMTRGGDGANGMVAIRIHLK